MICEFFKAKIGIHTTSTDDSCSLECFSRVIGCGSLVMRKDTDTYGNSVSDPAESLNATNLIHLVVKISSSSTCEKKYAQKNAFENWKSSSLTSSYHFVPVDAIVVTL